VLIENIASIFIHNVIIECDSNMFLSSNKLKSIERNESISFSICFGCHAVFFLVIESVDCAESAENFCHQRHEHL
jgi:hypothetical protein